MKLKKLWRFISAHEKVIVKLLLKDGFGSVEECVKIYKERQSENQLRHPAHHAQRDGCGSSRSARVASLSV